MALDIYHITRQNSIAYLINPVSSLTYNHSNDSIIEVLWWHPQGLESELLTKEHCTYEFITK